MKLLFDLHTHTTASGHAYSSFQENLAQAKAVGLQGYGMSDHTEMMPGASNNIFFENYKVVPREIHGIQILCGAEVNIFNYDGEFDLAQSICKKMDYIIASLHSPCIKAGSISENTNALIGAMKHPYVTIIGHPDDSRYPLDYDLLVSEAVKHQVVLELNNSSLRPGSTRQNGYENAKRLLERCKAYKAPIIVSTDSHISYEVGQFTEAIQLLQAVSFPEELICNISMDNLSWVRNNRV